MEKYSPDKRFFIRRVIEKDSASYMESETRWRWEVVSAKKGKVARVFYGSEYGSSSGWTYTGVQDVSFSEDGKRVIVTNSDDTVEKQTL